MSPEKPKKDPQLGDLQNRITAAQEKAGLTSADDGDQQDGTLNLEKPATHGDEISALLAGADGLSQQEPRFKVSGSDKEPDEWGEESDSKVFSGDEDFDLEDSGPVSSQEERGAIGGMADALEDPDTRPDIAPRTPEELPEGKPGFFSGLLNRFSSKKKKESPTSDTDNEYGVPDYSLDDPTDVPDSDKESWGARTARYAGSDLKIFGKGVLELGKNLSGYKVFEANAEYQAKKAEMTESQDMVTDFLGRRSFLLGKREEGFDKDLVNSKFNEITEELRTYFKSLDKNNPEDEKKRQQIVGILRENKNKKSDLFKEVQESFKKDPEYQEKKLQVAKEMINSTFAWMGIGLGAVSGGLSAGALGAVTGAGSGTLTFAKVKLVNKAAFDTYIRMGVHKKEFASGIRETFNGIIDRKAPTSERVKAAGNALTYLSLGVFGALGGADYLDTNAEEIRNMFSFSSEESLDDAATSKVDEKAEMRGANKTEAAESTKVEVAEQKIAQSETAEKKVVQQEAVSEQNKQGTEDTKGAAVESAPDTKPVAMEVSKGSGGIGAMHELRDKLIDEYKDPATRPEMVNYLLDPEKTPTDLAEEFGLYNPDSPNESFMLREGDRFVVDPEKGLSFVSGETTAELYNKDGVSTLEKLGRMFDSDGDAVPQAQQAVETAANTSERVISQVVETAKEVTAHSTEAIVQSAEQPAAEAAAQVAASTDPGVETDTSVETDVPAAEPTAESAPQEAPQPPVDQAPQTETTPIEPAPDYTPTTSEDLNEPTEPQAPKTNLSSEPSLFAANDHIPEDMFDFAKMLDRTEGGFERVNWGALPEDFGPVVVGESGTGILVGDKEIPIVHSYDGEAYKVSLYKDGFYGKPTSFTSESGMKDVLYKALLEARRLGSE